MGPTSAPPQPTYGRTPPSASSSGAAAPAIATFAGKVGRCPDESPAFVFPPSPSTPLSLRMLTIADMGHTWPEKDVEGIDGTKLLLEFFDGKSKP